MDIKKLIEKNNRPDLAKESGMVYQVWEDGEVTLQKSGEILWQRSLHCIMPGFSDNTVPLDYFPLDNRRGGHAYIFTTKEGAQEIHRAICYGDLL